ncbi:MAG: discoidin domain-containing protein [Bacteroidota bacterium]|nr:discoidin domain-containing protein [Bacteroidota bacterium]
MKIIKLIVLLFLLLNPAVTQVRVLDDYEDIKYWMPIVSDGASMNITQTQGYSGKGLALQFEFHGSGYAIAQKRLKLLLPENYKFTFYLRGDAPVNNFEFKLLDTAGNVFWTKKLNVEFSKEWTKRTIKMRHITFAWGPSGGGKIKDVDKIEFVVSAGTGGGKGTIYIDEFKIEPITEATPNLKLVATASSFAKNSSPQFAIDANNTTIWMSGGQSEQQWLVIDFQEDREFGGMVIDWEKEKYAEQYDVAFSDDGKNWTTVYRVTSGNGDRDYIYLPEAETRFLRLNLKKSINNKNYGIRNIDVKSVEFGSSPNAFIITVASDAPRGYFPKYFSNQMSYWTIVGVSGDTKEAMINEEGMIEVDKASFSLEPFLYLNGKFITWNEVSITQSLDRSYLPIPIVEWKYNDFILKTTTFAANVEGKPVLIVNYTAENKSDMLVDGKLFVTLRPFQVNPPSQDLNMVGGTANIRSIKYSNGIATVNDVTQVLSLSTHNAFGAAEFDQGDITSFISRGEVPPTRNITDHFGYASAAFEYDLALPSGSSKDNSLIVPFDEKLTNFRTNQDDTSAKSLAIELLDKTQKFWETKLSAVEFKLPKSAEKVVNTLKSNIAYILINRDGPAIQPGSRSYERSWIRDGALTSSALLYMGITDEVREYIDWYAKYQFPDGKIPCVVDSRGADPVPEHDSHGEFIYLVMQYFHFTKDTIWLRGKFDNITKAVRYIQFLRNQRKTDDFKYGTPEQRAMFGLVPESISHEGYSAKPMHSYWDDFWVLRGLKDATAIAQILGEKNIEKEFNSETDDFQICLYASMRLAMQNKNIDYIPGCVELGDFDATSTAIGVNPIGELGNIPEPQLINTFDRYYKFFTDRRDGKIDWLNYTPYEVRIIGAYVFMSQKQRAHELLNFFFEDQRPRGWNHWAEVVWKNPNTPRFIGDMPHTWVASDFIRSVRSMFAYEREKDTSLVIGAGIPEDWLNEPDGIEVKKLTTYYGVIDYSMKKTGESLIVKIGGNIQIPPGKIILRSPLSNPIVSVQINGKQVKQTKRGIEIKTLPATVILKSAR